MKRVLLSVLLFLSSFAYAGTVIPVYWGFSPASNQANILRAIIDSANKSQEKYLFVFVNKQGAGGSIAVNEVLSSKSPKLMMMSTSLFVRAKYYPTESYDVDNVQPIAVVAKGAPLVFLSGKYKTLDELKAAKDVTIGMINGSIIESAVDSFISTNNLKSVIKVPYKNSVDARIDTIAGTIDATAEFYADGVQWISDGKLYKLGETGKAGSEYLVANYYIFTGKSQSTEFVEEMNRIFSKAAVQKDVADLWSNDKAVVTSMTVKESVQFFNQNRAKWQ